MFYVQNSPLWERAREVVLALAAFHALRHVWKCQVFNAPRNVERAACTDGEGCERCWSYVGRFAPVTRIMRPLHRRFILNMAFARFRDNIHKSLARRLAEKHVCTLKKQETARADLDAALSDIRLGHR